MELSLRTALDFALDAAWQAGRITLRYFQTNIAVDQKQDNSPVTVADRETEQLLRSKIGQYYPEHGIIGEEFGNNSNGKRYCWIIDPIDGTKSFIHGVPLYGVLIALVENNTSLIGVAHFPALNETVYAARGTGCYLNGRRATVSPVGDLSKATLLASSITMPDERKNEAFGNLLKSTYINRTWGDAYGYALVATGRAEIMVDGGMAVWDTAPLPVILEEAGGTLTDWDGKSNIYAKQTVATNGMLFQPVKKLLNWAG